MFNKGYKKTVILGDTRITTLGATAMDDKKHGLTVVDLFCGAGGFSLGFHQAGFDVVLGVDNWKTACKTHEINGLGETRNIDLLDFDADKVFSLKKELEAKYGKIDVLIGSPPCTEFSYAKKGGKGDFEKGMILVRRHLLFVAIFEPKYWLMENVPRIEHALEKECSGSKEKGWQISYKKLGISKKKATEFGLKGNSLKIPKGRVLVASDFGAHQNRKRFIAGDFPLRILNLLKVGPKKDISLRGIICKFEDTLKQPNKKGLVSDPNYPHHKVSKEDIKDHHYDSSLHPMYWEEMRHLKRRHIQYGRMHLPENFDAPARTIMATYNAASRESLILPTEKTVEYHGNLRRVYRQPTVREVACIQGFPVDFQLLGRRLTNRYKLIGNAVPCQLSFALAKAITADLKKRLKKIDDSQFLKRAKATLDNQSANNRLPIMPIPSKIVDEAKDFGHINKEFKAKRTKRLRRKILSSSIRGDSCVIIFENTDLLDEKRVGGPFWKSCMQKGVGKQFHRIYIDDIAIEQLMKALESRIDLDELKMLIMSIYQEIEKGIPVVTYDWIEFPRWHNNPESYLRHVSKKHNKIPSASFFQQAFTEEMESLGNYISPIDFFDGLDAIMIKVFSRKEFNHLKSEFLLVNSVHDSNQHPYRRDSRIIPHLKDTKIPIITVASAFLSVFSLFKMYQNDPIVKNSDYGDSLKMSQKKVLNWFSC